ncbi:L-histidine N(alpha)-methyltransferase [Carboxylicivirga sp. N1Y90]|uniref:L-histidine N(alpha)-methyltransferase n=1 Tax=Carboxylicivirga fragile TaxID=3417571 RepID=UPI003D329E82|nr:L-histidine N(alpha)-methyltransferase [Marinilabiliaceae bacterium N1Y90]
MSNTTLATSEQKTQAQVENSLAQRLSIRNELKKLSNDLLRNEIISGLNQDHKSISSKFFYNKRGSLLFEWITKLPEYYPTRTEKAVIKRYAPQLFGNQRSIDLVELGSGDCSKISLVLNAIPDHNRTSITYRPVDFSESAVDSSTKLLNSRFPDLKIEGLVADFTQQLESLPYVQPRLICFFGSTIGNFTPALAQKLLSQIANTMNSGDQLILGVDMVKDKNTIEAAYNDSQRITEAFNKNILHAVNGYLQSDISPIDFKHIAFFNKTESRIEMHLEAKNELWLESPYLANPINIKAGECIHTENSYKYTEQVINKMASQSQLFVNDILYDDNKWFALVHLMK